MREINKRRKMTQGKEKKKSAIINDKREEKRTRGNAEPPQTAEEREKRELESCSGGLQVNSADVELNQTKLRGQAEHDDTDELPTLFSLVIQR